MKIHIGWVLLIAVIACLAGALFATMKQAIATTQRLSLVGQTLTSLSQSIEVEKQKTGTYPDSIDNLVVVSSVGDFSTAVLKQITYRKTETGYIAFAGIPRLGYIEPGHGVISQ